MNKRIETNFKNNRKKTGSNSGGAAQIHASGGVICGHRKSNSWGLAMCEIHVPTEITRLFYFDILGLCRKSLHLQRCKDLPHMRK